MQAHKFRRRKEPNHHRNQGHKETNKHTRTKTRSDYKSKGHRGILQRTTTRQKPKKQRNIEDNHRSKETMTETKDTQEK
jgi:hypothetical protein